MDGSFDASRARPRVSRWRLRASRFLPTAVAYQGPTILDLQRGFIRRFADHFLDKSDHFGEAGEPLVRWFNEIPGQQIVDETGHLRLAFMKNVDRNMAEHPGFGGLLSFMRRVNVRHAVLLDHPNWLRLQELEFLNLSNVSDLPLVRGLRSLGPILRNSPELLELHLNRVPVQTIGYLPDTLIGLVISQCELADVQTIGRLTELQLLELECLPQVNRLPDFTRLENLVDLQIVAVGSGLQLPALPVGLQHLEIRRSVQPMGVPQWLLGMTNLQTLTLVDVGLTDLPTPRGPTSLPFPTDLVHVNLSSNMNLTHIPAILFDCMRLMTLTIDYSGVLTVPVEIFRLTELRTLSMFTWAEGEYTVPDNIADLHLQQLILNPHRTPDEREDLRADWADEDNSPPLRSVTQVDVVTAPGISPLIARSVLYDANEHEEYNFDAWERERITNAMRALFTRMRNDRPGVNFFTLYYDEPVPQNGIELSFADLMVVISSEDAEYMAELLSEFYIEHLTGNPVSMEIVRQLAVERES